jgi:hypothetical protein
MTAELKKGITYYKAQAALAGWLRAQLLLNCSEATLLFGVCGFGRPLGGMK